MKNLLRTIKSCWEYGIGHATLAAVCAHSVSISIGMCQGYSAILIPQLISSGKIIIDQEQSSWLASFGAITNPVGSILSGLLAQWFGRKISMQFSSIPFIIGWICIGAAGDIYTLYIGRLITGISGGMAAASYTYVTEISTPKTRGIFQAFGPICASIGILLTYTLGYFISWNTVAYIFVLFAVATFVVVQLLPESPNYLFLKQKHDESLQSLVWLRRNKQIAEEELNRYRTAGCGRNEEGLDGCSVYMSATTVKPFAILVALFFLQQLSGTYSILFYAVNFFETSNVEVSEYIASIIVGAIRLVMSIICAVLVNHFGRKSLFVVSGIGMTISMLVMVVYVQFVQSPEHQTTFTVISLTCILSNVVFSMVGMIPIPWIITGEMFSHRVRSVMSGLVICIAQVFIFVSVKVYPDMMEHLKFSGTCLVFMSGSSIASLFSWSFLPETKNQSLEEIECSFVNKKVDCVDVDNPGFDDKSENCRNVEKNDTNVFSVRVS